MSYVHFLAFCMSIQLSRFLRFLVISIEKDFLLLSLVQIIFFCSVSIFMCSFIFVFKVCLAHFLGLSFIFMRCEVTCCIMTIFLQLSSNLPLTISAYQSTHLLSWCLSFWYLWSDRLVSTHFLQAFWLCFHFLAVQAFCLLTITFLFRSFSRVKLL